MAFLVIIPSDFRPRVDRKDNPQIVVEADATDPSAASNAIGALDVITRRALVREQGLEGKAAESSASRISIVVHKRYNPDGFSQYVMADWRLDIGGNIDPGKAEDVAFLDDLRRMASADQNIGIRSNCPKGAFRCWRPA